MEPFQLFDIVDAARGESFFLYGKTLTGQPCCVEVFGMRNSLLIEAPVDCSDVRFLKRMQEAFITFKLEPLQKLKRMSARAFMKTQKWPKSHKFKVLTSDEYSEADAKDIFLEKEEEKLRDKIDSMFSLGHATGRSIADVSPRSIVEDYSKDFLKVFCTNKYDFYTLKKALRSAGFYEGLYREQPMLYNSNVSRHQRWLLEYNIKPCYWLTLKNSEPMRELSKGKLDAGVLTASVNHDDVVCKFDNEVAPLVVLALDLEVEPIENNKAERQADPSVRPDVTFRGIGEDNILQVSLVWTASGKMFQKLLFIDPTPVPSVEEMFSGAGDVGRAIPKTFDETDFKPSEAELVPCKTEAEMLEKLRFCILQIDADIITGYNVCSYDLHAIWKRCEALKVPKGTCWGRFKDVPCPMKVTNFNSRAFGASQNHRFAIGGRLVLDLYELMKKEHNLVSYKLDNVAKEFLGTAKLDVAYADIPRMQETAETRLEMGAYCLKDSWLVIKLLAKLCKIPNVIEMSRVTGIPLRDVLERGQMIRSLCSIYSFAKQHKPEYFLPEIKNTTKWNKSSWNTITNIGGLAVMSETTEVEKKGYQGAVVFPPTPGYYTDPVTVLDFASLYPSIIRFRNMCYSSKVSWKTIKELELVEDVDYHRIADVDIVGAGEMVTRPSANDTCFLTEKRRAGILPAILTELLAARKSAKKDKKNATDPNMRAVADGRQLALKVVCNSLYGFCGTSYGYLPCLPIAAAVTSVGRYLALTSKVLIEKQWPGTVCIYGDTDSVFIKIPESLLEGQTKQARIEEVAKLSEEMAEYCDISYHLNENGHIHLEFEKVYKPLVLLKKKRYFGLLYGEGKLDQPYADYKGIELKRRDGATITKVWQRDLMQKILLDNDLQGVRDYIAAGMAAIYLGKVPLEQFIMSAKLAKHPDNYKVQGAAVKLAVRQMKDSSLQVRVGDRIPFCIRSGYKGEKSSDRAVAPADIASGKYTLDIDYYVQRAIRKPLISFLKHCLPDIESLFVTHCRRVDCTAGIKRLFPAATLTERSKKRARIVRNPKPTKTVKATSIADFFK